MALKAGIVDFPTLGRPTIPAFNAIFICFFDYYLFCGAKIRILLELFTTEYTEFHGVFSFISICVEKIFTL